MTLTNSLAGARRSLRAHDIGTLGIVAIIAIVLGVLQSPLQVIVDVISGVDVTGPATADSGFWGASWTRYLDDLAALALVLAALLRIRRINKWLLIGISVWTLGLVIGLVHSLAWHLVSPSNAIELFRQVAFPTAILFAGAVMRAGERKWLSVTVIVLAVLNALYGALEWFGIRPLDPAIVAREHGVVVNPQYGLPNNFIGWWVDGSRIERVGGLFVNPPTAGIFLAVGLVFAVWTVRRVWLKVLLIVVLGLATAGTVSRAGWMVAAAGIIVPLVFRYLGRIIGSLLSIAVAVLGAYMVIANGGGKLSDGSGSVSHLTGMIAGLKDGLHNPLGRGFGFIGNFAENSTHSETLLGIGWSAGGWITLAASFVLAVVLLVDFWRSRGRRWQAAAALGGLGAAAFAETAGALNGTIPLWLLVGIAAAMATSGRATEENNAPRA